LANEGQLIEALPGAVDVAVLEDEDDPEAAVLAAVHLPDDAFLVQLPGVPHFCLEVGLNLLEGRLGIDSGDGEDLHGCSPRRGPWWDLRWPRPRHHHDPSSRWQPCRRGRSRS